MTIEVRSTDGVRAAVHDLGGDGPPLLFLHATGFHGRCYAPIAAHLTERFHVFAPDLRGHGDSVTPPTADLHWSNMAADTLAMVDHLGLDEPVWFAGHSMGGAAVVLAELTRPGLVRGGWLFEPIIFPHAPDTGAVSRANPLADLARRRRQHFASFQDAYDNYASKPPFAGIHPDALRAYVEHGFRPDADGVILKCSGESEARVFEGVDTSIFDRLGAVSTPITVVGSGDGDPPANLAPTIAARLGNGRAEAWPDRTHFGPFEDPARAAASLSKALSR